MIIGRDIIIDPKLEKTSTKSPTARKINPPICSCFQVKAITPSKTNEGKRCIKRGRKTFQPLNSENTSSENKDRNKTNPILKTLGNQ